MSSDHREPRRASLRDRIAAVRDAQHEQRRLRQQARSGGGGLSSEQIASAAVAIADAQGLDGLSMRKIAAVLGSGTMSLYHHVRTKDDLIEIMDDLIMGEVLVPARALKAGWREALAVIARHSYATFARHPWALTAKRSSQRGLNSLRHVDQSFGALADTGLDLAAKAAILIIVDDYVFGRATRAQSMPRFDKAIAAARMSEAAAFLGEQLATGSYPNLSAVFAGSTPEEVMRQMIGKLKPDDWFEQGLEVMLDGIALRFGLPAKAG